VMAPHSETHPKPRDKQDADSQFKPISSTDSVPARICTIVVRQSGNGRRSRPGDFGEGLAGAQHVRAWNEPESMALHILRNQVLFGPAACVAPGAVGPGRGGADSGSSAEQASAAEIVRYGACALGLSDEQREALILVGAGGFSYEDAAAICRCAVGTVKSRVALRANRCCRFSRRRSIAASVTWGERRRRK